MRAFLNELRRRKVFTVGAAYVVIAWLLLQVAATVFPIYEAPPWVLKVFTVLLALGLPLAVVLAWAYDLTPGGVVRKASKLNPRHPDYYHTCFGVAAFASGDYERALARLLRADLPEWPPHQAFLAATEPGAALPTRPGRFRRGLPVTDRMTMHPEEKYT